MWYGLHKSPDADPEFVRSTTELLQSTSRHLIWTIGGVYLAWHLMSTVTWPDSIGWNTWLITPVVALTFAVSLWLLPKQMLAAQVVWQVGLAATITLAVTMFQQPQIAFLYALLPLMAVVTVGWPAGLIVEAMVVALTVWLSRGLVAPPLPTAQGLAIVAGGALTGLLGWAAARALLVAIQWYLFSFGQAQVNMEEARQHRAHLARVLKDLDQACYRLERANHMLVLARAEAEEAKEARNRFALAVSHELRTPLNFIIGFSELMVNSPDTYGEAGQWPPGLYEDIKEIYRSSKHLLRLVNDVLDLGQIEALQMTLIKEWVEPACIVQEVADMVRPAFARKRLWFRTEVQPDLPTVFVDHTRIRQVLLNLVSNGLRVTEQGGVTVSLRRDGESLEFCVEHTGPGIADGDIPKVFEDFRQVGSGSWRRREGAGLGIPISRRFVELHGGRMWVDSQVGAGAAFHFSLPLPGTAPGLLSSLTEGAADVHYWRRLAERAEGERMLLVLSSDPAAGEVIARYAEDYETISVPAPDMVCRKVAEFLPSALIVDHTLIQDKDVQSTLQDLPYDLPVISFPFPGSGRHGSRLPAGVARYLVKPIAREDLAEAVRALGPGIRKLLIVDDDPAMVRFVTLALKRGRGEVAMGDGYQLASASTGTEALQQLGEDLPDAVLLDLALPDVSGWTVLELMRQDPDLGRVPVILITAHDWPQMYAGGGGEALRVVMRRPFSRDELSSVLRGLLDAIHLRYPAVSVGPVRPGDPSV